MGRWLAGIAVGFVVLSNGLLAQENQPVYPVYDGFVKNPDGSYTLSFAYFSHNANEVTIPPGANNSFAPTPGDRMQPITFLPGHWRYQCVMVVPADFDGKMKWTLNYGGVSTGTSGGTGTAPAWVKLERRGSIITAYQSADGVSWTVVASDTFTMPADVYVGLAVSSHDTTRLATATFDGVSVR